MSAKEVSSFFTGFFVGALVGGAAALLFAPQSGEQTRAQIRDRSIELKEKAEATYEEVVDEIEETTAELRGRLQELSSKMDELIAQGKSEIERVTAKGSEEVPVVEAAEEAAAEA
jgi:gas vesicle protein